jgi:hypothetical protein
VEIIAWGNLTAKQSLPAFEIVMNLSIKIPTEFSEGGIMHLNELTLICLQNPMMQFSQLVSLLKSQHSQELIDWEGLQIGMCQIWWAV